MRERECGGLGQLGGLPRPAVCLPDLTVQQLPRSIRGLLERHMPKGHAYWDGQKEASEDLHSQTPGLGCPLPEHKGLLGCD